jgi:phosphatidylserine decarboxylase
MYIMFSKIFSLESLTAIGTVGAVVVSLYFSTKESRDRTKREKQAQASQISGWVGGKIPKDNPYYNENESLLTLFNNSNQPVYNVVARTYIRHPEEHNKLHDYDTEKRCGKIEVLPPGKFVTIVYFSDGGMCKTHKLEISFQDSYGISWKRKTNGILVEIFENPFDYHGVERPVNYSVLLEIESTNTSPNIDF